MTREKKTVSHGNSNEMKWQRTTARLVCTSEEEKKGTLLSENERNALHFGNKINKNRFTTVKIILGQSYLFQNNLNFTC